MRPPARPRPAPRRPAEPARPRTQPAASSAAASHAEQSPSPARSGAGRSGQDGPARPGQAVADRAGRAVGPSRGPVPAVLDPAALPERRRPEVVSQGMAVRLAERRSARRHRLWLRAGTAGGAAVLVLAVGWVLMFSPLLRLEPQEVRLSGLTDAIDEVGVQEVVDGAVGTPLPRLDTVVLRERMLQVPGVRDARIVRDWPHGLSVELTPRVPVAAVPHEGRLLLVDEDGVALGDVDQAPEGVPVVDVPPGEENRRTLEAALIILNALPPELAVEMASVEARSPDTVATVLRDGARVEWGSAHDVRLKVEVLRVLRLAEASRGARVFDVSAPTVPITR